MAASKTTVQIVMPAMGESVTEGVVLAWLKQVGESVVPDEPLVEVSTDKVDAEVPSPAAGVLSKILVDPDETVDVGAVLGEIDGQSGEAAHAVERVEEDLVRARRAVQPLHPGSLAAEWILIPVSRHF